MKKVSDLRELNFGDLIRLGDVDPRKYSYADYKKNGFIHPKPLGYCVSCEEKRIHTANDGPGYQLRNMSHGAHSEDFLDALPTRPDNSDWRKEPVVFVFETPSINYGDLYAPNDYKGFKKRPTQQWYWIHEDLDPASYPDHFKGGTYGELILSVILTFRLSNAYATNLVKCALNTPGGNQFRGLGSFKNACIENCYQNFLSKEIGILKPRVVFAFGAAVEGWLQNLLPDNTYLQQLPHPAGRRRGFRDEHYKVLYFWLITRALYTTGMLQLSESRELAKNFLAHFDGQ